MRNSLVFTCALIASGIGLMAPALAQDAQYYPPSAYRPYGYYPSEIPAPSAGDATQAPAGSYVPPPPHASSAPPPEAAAGVPPPPPVGAVVQAPAEQAVVLPAPVIVVPPRPASCGEFRFWNGFACVDARFNQPYLGPRY